ncbi:FG-GAP-like repeat-containing protein [Rhabdochromatium marinum]|uniref:FG-GAP-like repeat-containing protein n=1 Tax=Rhabdochromatium marinum TaxID=48729 RepID=UPI0019084BC9|nr:FG-GAP-like repeat-containing protein [Rhabdochromatium marinum]MBK1647125.1 hypothetical protein [Rhabdochromatium marinum]
MARLSTIHATIALGGLLCLSSSIISAASYNLAWDPVEDSRVAGYRLHYGEVSGEYTKTVDVGKNTQHSVAGIPGNKVYYFTVTAYDGAGNESPPSDEVKAEPSNSSKAKNFADASASTASNTKSNDQRARSLRTIPGSATDDAGLTNNLSPTDIGASLVPKLLTGFGPDPINGGWAMLLNSDWFEENRILLDWPEYNALSGEIRPATGDIDGDGHDEIVIGLGPVEGVPEIPQGTFRVLDDDLTPLAWGQIEWTDYNNQNGETIPAVGDIDGDGRAEIIIGLGAGGQGMLQIFSYQNGALVSSGWAEVDWADYAKLNGETRPAAGDVDGDGVSDLVIGFGRTAGIANGSGGGNFVIKNHITGIAPSIAGQPSSLIGSNDQFVSLSWADYGQINGETWPTTGDIDQDGRDDVILGLGEGGDGVIELFRSEPDGYALPLGFVESSQSGNGTRVGAVRPAARDLNGDGRVEVIAGRGLANEGRIEVFENVSSVLLYRDSIFLKDTGETGAIGQVWPAFKQ